MSLTCLLDTELPPFRESDAGSLGAWEAPRRHWGSDGASGPEERPRCTPDPQEHKAFPYGRSLCRSAKRPLVIRAAARPKNGLDLGRTAGVKKSKRVPACLIVTGAREALFQRLVL